MKTLLCIAGCLYSLCTWAQTPEQVIKEVLTAQQKLDIVAYSLQRTDTFVTGDTRITTGLVKLQVVPADSVFGCWFWGKRDDVARETIYDGKKSIQLDRDQKQYEVMIDPSGFPHLLGTPGGQMLLTDLVKLDTGSHTGFSLEMDEKNFYLTKYLPDITAYDVSKRVTVYTIDRQTKLVMARRSRQETLGKVQDLNYVIKNIWINDQTHRMDFGGDLFPKDYTMVQREQKPKVSPLLNQPAPAFQLTSLDQNDVTLATQKGKVVLLDFLEVWCGPCFASVPKIQSLADKYKSSGLQVYGISFEHKQVASLKKLLARFSVNFPVLLGNDVTRSAYDVNAIPRYVLINRKGLVTFSTEGFSAAIEQAIVSTLAEQ